MMTLRVKLSDEVQDKKFAIGKKIFYVFISVINTNTYIYFTIQLNYVYIYFMLINMLYYVIMMQSYIV